MLNAVQENPWGDEAGDVDESSPERHRTRRRWLLFVTAGLLLAGVLCWGFLSLVHTDADPETLIEELIETEEWILKTTPELKKLSQSVMNLRLPDHQAVGLFAKSVALRGVRPGSVPLSERAIKELDISALGWPPQSDWRSSPRDELAMWEPLFERTKYFLHASFYFINAQAGPSGEIEAEMGFEGLARSSDDHLVHVTAKQHVVWRPAADVPRQGRKGTREAKPAHPRQPLPPAEADWEIAAWEQESLESSQRQRPLFREVVDSVLPDKTLRERARVSIHERILVELATGKRTDVPHRHFGVHADDRHPGLCVVDIDRDGLDDLYVMPRLGRNMLLHNRGDGTFADIAAELGLDIENHCAAAVFADFDNDGDVDCFLGRTLRPSMYLVNEGGPFVDRSQDLVATKLPYLVYSASAADYNNDGLLDVFLATNAVLTVRQEVTLRLPQGSTALLSEFLPEEQAREMYRRQQQEYHDFVARIGPPNVLLVNRGGGRFDLAPESEQVAAWRNTTQGTWSDWDDDGDQDLYLSNDFSINTMLRNDGPQGFTDVTEATGTADIGFGMGVSFGDYDNDGRQDLYVSNMYSKAGRRITARVKELDPRFARMARGNSLFRNRGDRFEKVSGLKPPRLLVEKAGWAWGGQFVDVDNDGYLDLYALNGQYTAPPEVALPVDL